MKDGSPMAVAGLWEEWKDPATGELYQTTVIVTTEGNPMMALIHNNPKADGPRMPVILPKEKQDEWLMDINSEEDKEKVQGLIKPFDESLLTAHTVARILGKNAIGNVQEVENEVIYPELVMTGPAQTSLF